MLYDLSNPYDRQRFKERVRTLAERQAAVVLTEKKPQRTLRQNAYLHTLLAYYGAEFGYTLDEVKVRFFKETCNADLFRRTATNRRGQQVTTLRSTAELSTAELTTAIERFRNWSASECGLYLPSADDHRHLLFAEQEIQRVKEHI